MKRTKSKGEEQDIKSFLDVTYKDGFSVAGYNLLDNPDVIASLYDNGYRRINVNPRFNSDGNIDEENILDNNMLLKSKPENVQIIIVLRYFEYLCIASVRFDFILKILHGEYQIINVFDMIKHHLRNTLVREVSGEETIVDMHIEYRGYVKYY
jgi:hypothetical protein